MVLGRRIQNERVSTGMTRQEFADKVHSSSAMIECVEYGTKNPGVDLLWRISKTLKKPMEYFMYDPNEDQAI